MRALDRALVAQRRIEIGGDRLSLERAAPRCRADSSREARCGSRRAAASRADPAACTRAAASGNRRHDQGGDPANPAWCTSRDSSRHLEGVHERTVAGGAGHSLSRIASVRAQNLGDNPDAMVLVAIGFVIALSSQSSGAPPTSQSSDNGRGTPRTTMRRKRSTRRTGPRRSPASSMPIASDRSPDANIRTYGSNFLTFVPDYYLGVAISISAALRRPTRRSSARASRMC